MLQIQDTIAWSFKIVGKLIIPFIFFFILLQLGIIDWVMKQFNKFNG